MPALSSRLDAFLAGVETRAYRMAQLATGGREEALDIVQEAMLGLTARYAHKPETEWRSLFYRILQNRIRDWRRRHIVRTRWRNWLGFRKTGRNEPEADAWQQIPDHRYRPDDETMRGLAIGALDEALGRLPLRQQQAFLLRAWEGLTVNETARAMRCSAGALAAAAVADWIFFGPSTRTGQEHALAAMDDMDLLTSGEPLEIYEDFEFYSWLSDLDHEFQNS